MASHGAVECKLIHKCVYVCVFLNLRFPFTKVFAGKMIKCNVCIKAGSGKSTAKKPTPTQQ